MICRVESADGAANLFRLREIEPLPVQGRYLAYAGQRVVQFPPDLPIRPDQQDGRFHFFEYCGRNSRGIAARVEYFASFSETRGLATPQEMARSGSLQMIPYSLPGS